MKELDILLKENIPANAVITNILKKYSKNKINSIEHVAINNKAILNELLNVYKKDKEKNLLVKYDNNNKYKITLQNIEKMEYYNSEESKNKVKNKVNDIFQFIYIYIIFLIVPIYILSISLKGNYIYLLFTIMVIIIFSISIYNIYNTLQN
jgi:phosphopantetheine adenylyltransferase